MQQEKEREQAGANAAALGEEGKSVGFAACPRNRDSSEAAGTTAAAESGASDAVTMDDA